MNRSADDRNRPVADIGAGGHLVRTGCVRPDRRCALSEKLYLARSEPAPCSDTGGYLIEEISMCYTGPTVQAGKPMTGKKISGDALASQDFCMRA